MWEQCTCDAAYPVAASAAYMVRSINNCAYDRHISYLAVLIVYAIFTAKPADFRIVFNLCNNRSQQVAVDEVHRAIRAWHSFNNTCNLETFCSQL
jgi:hypothetical protein